MYEPPLKGLWTSLKAVGGYILAAAVLWGIFLWVSGIVVALFHRTALGERLFTIWAWLFAPYGLAAAALLIYALVGSAAYGVATLLGFRTKR